MATRPVFVPLPDGSLVTELNVDFEWFPGFAVSQKQKSITAMHEAAGRKLGGGRILEVSTKSPDRVGWALSAFNLRLTTVWGQISVEAAFQGSKVFARSGQHPEIYEMRSGRDIKRVVAEFAGEPITGFVFEDRPWTLQPTTAFYDWLYLRALVELEDEQPSLASDLRTCVGFTDIEFNPDRSLNCQARSCALYAALSASTPVRALLGDPDRFTGELTERGYWSTGVLSTTEQQGELF